MHRHANLAQVPADYIRKQTTVGAERFVVEEQDVRLPGPQDGVERVLRVAVADDMETGLRRERTAQELAHEAKICSRLNHPAIVLRATGF